MLVLTTLLQLTNSYNISGEKVTEQEGRSGSAHLVLTFNDRNSTDGFYELLVETSQKSLKRDNITDQEQAYLAGYVEGKQTARLISMYYRNLVKDLNQSMVGNNYTFDSFYFDYAEKQIEYIQSQVNATRNLDDDPEKQWQKQWWHGVDLIVNHWLRGLVNGHNDGDPDFQLNRTQLYLMNAQGDMDDLGYFIDPAKHAARIRDGMFHRCTAAVRLTDDRKDVFFSQNTWCSFYSGFIRIAKQYVLHFDLATQEQNVKFSSYPGLFFSLDDFYMLRNIRDNYTTNMAVLETTFHTFNTSLYDEWLDKDGKAVLMWTRVQLANMQAINASEWNKTFQYNHSYTYNNGYVLMDYLKYEKALLDCPDCSLEDLDQKLLESQFIATLEVVPGHPKFFDVTKVLLDQGFYIQINVPEDPELYNVSGYAKENEKDGSDYWSYENGARKCISDRILPTVNTLEEYKEFVRYNDYKHDNCSKGDPGQSIASRYDLRDSNAPRGPSLFGCTDSKVTNLQMSKSGHFLFYIGQTYNDNLEIPQFNYTEHENEAERPEGYFDVFPGVWALANLVYSDDKSSGDITGVICSIAIPVAIILVLLITWSVVFYKRGGYNRIRRPAASAAEEEALLDQDENQTQ